MIQFDLPKQKSSIIKVLGVGGGGSNAVNFMFHQDIEGVDFIICNTDSKAIEQSPVPNKIQLGPHLTQGLGAGADPSVGKLATEESLEEIKRILEVNTKMAFITVGMGGGTGTGGAPIIAKICKDLGILTVGIVTTPFGFEGPRRQKQAEDGINQLKPLVDTLLVISNDKLRMQYGNLKMKEAFTKADNVLATAAKCITDVINSRGHIIVDFADVCTVMKNGGVAILGKAEVEGENRAQRAIEEALNSPLLNDNDIKGAKWILLNINSAEGDFECSMDELETISSILRERTGEHSDVIMGSGYDDSLGEKIGITLIATGFEGKDPFKKEEVKKEESPVEEKIVMTLTTEAPTNIEPVIGTETSNQAEVENSLVLSFEEEVAPVQMEIPSAVEEATAYANLIIEAADDIDHLHLAPSLVEAAVEETMVSNVFVEVPEATMEAATAVESESFFELNMEEETHVDFTEAFVLSKPSNIYAEEENAIAFDESGKVNAFDESGKVNAFDEVVVPNTDVPEMESPVASAPAENFQSSFRVAVEEAPAMQLVMREESTISKPAAQFEMGLDESEEQRRKVRERIQKLRNLSFNIGSGSEANAEFDEVPAYVRRNMDLFGNTLASVENYYSKYTVEQDDNNQTQISTINTFLDGKKPD
ncbi:MAG: cell division protein FtsZ [Bacteroidota bacterium]